MRVLTIGAGLSGIQLAYQIQKYTQNVEHVIYEKNARIGGTWLENRYPGMLYEEHARTHGSNYCGRVRMRHSLTRLHPQLCTEPGLAPLLLLRSRHPQVSRESLRCIRSTQIHDVQHRSGPRRVAGRSWKVESHIAAEEPFRRGARIRRRMRSPAVRLGNSE